MGCGDFECYRLLAVLNFRGLKSPFRASVEFDRLLFSSYGGSFCPPGPVSENVLFDTEGALGTIRGGWVKVLQTDCPPSENVPKLSSFVSIKHDGGVSFRRCTDYPAKLPFFFRWIWCVK